MILPIVYMEVFTEFMSSLLSRSLSTNPVLFPNMLSMSHELSHSVKLHLHPSNPCVRVRLCKGRIATSG